MVAVSPSDYYCCFCISPAYIRTYPERNTGRVPAEVFAPLFSVHVSGPPAPVCRSCYCRKWSTMFREHNPDGISHRGRMIVGYAGEDPVRIR